MSEEYSVVEGLIKDAQDERQKLLNRQQDFNMATVNARKLGLQDRIDRFVALMGAAGPQAAVPIQHHIDRIQESYDYWNGPEPANERTKLGPQIAELSQLIAQLTQLLATLPEPE